MPRTKLDVITPERQREITNKVIRHGMVEAGIDSSAELAQLIGMDVQAVRRRFRDGKWTIEELQRIVSVLNLSAAAAGKMLGCKPAA